MDGSRRIVFPLATSVELFEDPESPAAAARAKFASVLFDEVIFETGLYEVTVTDGGSHATRRPAASLTPDDLRGSRRIEPGEPFQLAMGVQLAEGIPAPPEAMRVVMAGKVSKHFVAEWHSIVTDAGGVAPDWMYGFDTPETLPTNLREQVDHLDREARGQGAALEPNLRSWAVKAFNRDSVLAADLGAAFAVTSLFAPLVPGRGVELSGQGHTALDVLVPDLGDAPWEAIAEFRSHPASEEVRELLRALEAEAAGHSPDAALTQRDRVQNRVNDLLFKAIKETRPSLPEEIGRQAVTGAASVVVPIVAPLASIAQTAKNIRDYDRSALAAIMRLRDRVVADSPLG